MNTLAVIVVGLAATSGVAGHGYINKPAARQTCAKDSYMRVNTHAGFGVGNTGEVLGGLPSFCGDPFRYSESDFENEAECEPQETYTQGGIMEMEYKVTVAHGGFMTCNLCDSTAMSDECFAQYPMIATNENGAQHERFYFMDDREDWTIQWQLPADLSCEHCTMSCSWYALQACCIECEESVCGFYSECKNPVNYKNPGSDRVYNMCTSAEGGLAPEFGEHPQVFRNCVDLKIEASAGGTATTPTGGDNPTPAPGPSGDGAEEEAATPAAAPTGDGASDAESAGGTTPEPAEIIGEEESATPAPAPAMSNEREEAGTPATGPSEPEESMGGGCGGDMEPPCRGSDMAGRNYPCDYGYSEENNKCVPYAEKAADEKKTSCTGVQCDDDDDESPAEGPGEDFESIGSDVTCDDDNVKGFFEELTKRRDKWGNGPCICDEDALGAAYAWAEDMCQEGSTSTASDNCALAGLPDDCVQLTFDSDLGTSLSHAISPGDRKKIYDADVEYAGIASFECSGNGNEARLYWTILAA